jgi:D-amino-acid oxidase
VHYLAPLVDMPVYLAYLTKRLEAAGVAVEVDAVDSLAEAGSMAAAVVNCAGLGAKTLADDQDLFPIRGQQLVVSNPGLKDFLEVDTGDSPDLIAIYPHGKHVVLGGTAEPGSWSRERDPDAAKAILARCVAVQPLLQGTAVREHRVGLRPSRPEVRLEETQGVHGVRTVHNYGHGGAGVSLAWGCAEEVSSMLREE